MRGRGWQNVQKGKESEPIELPCFPSLLTLTPTHNAHILLPSFIIPLYEIHLIVR